MVHDSRQRQEATPTDERATKETNIYNEYSLSSYLRITSYGTVNAGPRRSGQLLFPVYLPMRNGVCRVVFHPGLFVVDNDEPLAAEVGRRRHK